GSAERSAPEEISGGRIFEGNAFQTGVGGVIAGDVGVPGAIYGDSLAGVVAVGRTIVMPNPKLITIRCILDCGDVIVGTGFYALACNVNVVRSIQRQPVTLIIVVCGAVVTSDPELVSIRVVFDRSDIVQIVRAAAPAGDVGISVAIDDNAVCIIDGAG